MVFLKKRQNAKGESALPSGYVWHITHRYHEKEFLLFMLFAARDGISASRG
jgi:hypothetical protein